MATPRTLLWPLEPHSKAKHLVLRNYLDAWLPILGSRSGRILFVDGFAGPGQYESGEEGSPVVALRAFAEHKAKQIIKGMSVRPLTSEEKKKESIEGGAAVTAVKPYSEAFNRGIVENTVILEADRKQVKSPGDLKKVIDGRKGGDSILMRIKRPDGTTQYVAVQLPKD